MHFDPRRLLPLAALVGILLAFGVPSASAANPCQTNTTTQPMIVCAFVTDRVLVFGSGPGSFAHGTIKRTSTIVGSGTNSRSSTVAQIVWNESAWTTFSEGWTAPSGEAMYALVGIPGVANHAVGVKASWRAFQAEGADPRSLSCVNPAYLVCSTPAVWSHNRPESFLPGTYVQHPINQIEAPATIESRLLYVKVLNMTEQPLVRTSDPRLSGVIRDEQISDPETIPAGSDGHTQAGYYHFYRDVSRDDSVAFSYTFADGVGETTLTHSSIDIDIAIDKDGSTEASSCTVPSGGVVTIECAVHVLGDADGILEAVVTVGV